MTNAADRELKKQEWLEKRRSYITGTDAAALLGIEKKYNSPRKVWLSKMGLAEPVVETEAMLMGKMLEPVILQRYQDSFPDNRLVYVDGYELITSEKFPRLGASLDGWNETLQCPVDSKNIGFKTPEWGEPGSSDVPGRYNAQLQVQMAVTGASMAQLAVLFHGQEFCVYTVQRDNELIERISSEAEKFFKEYIETGKEPELNKEEVSEKFEKNETVVNEKGKEVPVEIEPTMEIIDTIMRLKVLKASAKEVADEIELLENFVKAFMGTAGSVKGMCTWKNNKDSTETDWKAVAQRFANVEGFEKAVKDCTVTKPGARSFRITNKD